MLIITSGNKFWKKGSGWTYDITKATTYESHQHHHAMSVCKRIKSDTALIDDFKNYDIVNHIDSFKNIFLFRSNLEGYEIRMQEVIKKNGKTNLLEFDFIADAMKKSKLIKPLPNNFWNMQKKKFECAFNKKEDAVDFAKKIKQLIMK